MTLTEVLAFVALVAIVSAGITAGLRFKGGRLPSAVSLIRKDIQATYFQAINNSRVYRLQFDRENQSYVIELFQLPAPPPPEEDREAYREWEEAQKEKQEELEALGLEERRALTQLQRGYFEIEVERFLPETIELVEFYLADQEDPPQEVSLLVYPTGEMPSSLWIFEAENGESMTLITDGVGGRVRSFNGRVSLEEWREGKVY